MGIVKSLQVIDTKHFISFSINLLFSCNKILNIAYNIKALT